MIRKFIIQAITLFLVNTVQLANAAEVIDSNYASKLIGRWVVDNPEMCSDPKFKDAGLFYFFDKNGKLLNELRLPNNGQIQIIRRSIYQSIAIYDESNLVIKTAVLAENFTTKESYKTNSLIQFSEDYKTQFLLDQEMDGKFNIRDSIVLATKQKQSPFYKCEPTDSAKK